MPLLDSTSSSTTKPSPRLRGFKASRPPSDHGGERWARAKQESRIVTYRVGVSVCVPLGSRDRETMQIMQCTIQSAVLSARLRDYLP